MNTLRFRRSAITVMIALFTALSSGCAVNGEGYGYDSSVSVGIGLGYYGPYDPYYGGWGPGYRVAPIRGGGNYRPDRGVARPTPHVYRAAPGARPPPSIPSRPRTGGRRPH